MLRLLQIVSCVVVAGAVLLPGNARTTSAEGTKLVDRWIPDEPFNLKIPGGKFVCGTGDGMLAWGEGILRSAGGWADCPELDAIMEEIYRSRKVERRPQMEDV